MHLHFTSVTVVREGALTRKVFKLGHWQSEAMGSSGVLRNIFIWPWALGTGGIRCIMTAGLTAHGVKPFRPVGPEDRVRVRPDAEGAGPAGDCQTKLGDPPPAGIGARGKYGWGMGVARALSNGAEKRPQRWMQVMTRKPTWRTTNARRRVLGRGHPY